MLYKHFIAFTFFVSFSLYGSSHVSNKFGDDLDLQLNNSAITHLLSAEDILKHKSEKNFSPTLSVINSPFQQPIVESHKRLRKLSDKKTSESQKLTEHSQVTVTENSKTTHLEETVTIKELKSSHDPKQASNEPDAETTLHPEDLKTIKGSTIDINPRLSFDIKEDSDEEDATVQRVANFPKKIIKLGVLLKLMANVYLGKIDEISNIFLPKYKLEIDNRDKEEDFFRTPKGEICVFASGGTYNVWEKTVASVFETFFKQKVKIIRTLWLSKHLLKDKSIQRNLNNEFKDREKELHSELFFDIYFDYFFIPLLKVKAKGQPAKLTINAFSWWDVCNNCERLLTSHKDRLLQDKIEVSYDIAAKRRYNHCYPPNTKVNLLRIEKKIESRAWKKIWKKVSRYTKKTYKSEEEKRNFWTSTKEGIEICKWLAQAFVENKVTAQAKKAKLKGDILKFYEKMSDYETTNLRKLLAYLKEENWELSCWYKQKCPDPVQQKWKRNWKQLVIPHFGWEKVRGFNFKSPNKCQMCGNTKVYNLYCVFHPKFHPSKKFFELPESEQRSCEEFSGVHFEIPFRELKEVFQRKRRQSLCVGVECLNVLTRSREELEEWHQSNPEEEVKAKDRELVEREENLDALDKAEKELRKKQLLKKRLSKKGKK